MKIVFLSFSKCAGVAIRNAIARNNPRLRILPGWDRSHLCRFSRDDLNRYDVFAGHFDWSDLDCLEDERFVFTVLRPPFDRVISQYCYSKEKTGRMIASGRVNSNNPNSSLHMISKLSALDYFALKNSEWRDPILDEYDNVYMHYFFYRGYHGQRHACRNRISRSKVLQIALANMKHLDYIATFATLHSDLNEIERHLGIRFGHDLRNENTTAFGAGLDKRELVHQLDPSGRLRIIIEGFCSYDSILYEIANTHMFQREPQRRP